ncbi:MAG TPA: ABC transporter permease [Pirellulaceae bacterium]|nr:ABC transporter permease [Pirellulaceae bacterium]
MSWFRIALRSIQQRGVASLLTMLSMALGVTLVVAVLSIDGVLAESFRNNASLGYNIIVGAKGGQEQLVLNTVFFLSRPIENVPYTYYLEFLKQPERDRLQRDSYAARGAEVWRETAELQALTGNLGLSGAALDAVAAPIEQSLVPDMTLPRHPPVELKGRHGKYGQMTELAIPLCLGDFYGTFRVVGTTPALFDDLVYDIERNRKFEFAQGRNFVWRSPQHGYFEAVLGAKVASDIQLVELHLNVAGNAAARALVTERANWSRIDERDGALVVALGQGTEESDVFLSLRRLQKDAEEGKRQLDDEQQQALTALLDPGVVLRRSQRNVTLGDAIAPAHGEPGGHLHQRKFTVVGILKPSGTPNDRAVFINMEGFYLMEDHAKPVARPKPEEAAEGPPLSESEQRAQMAEDRRRQQEVERAADPEPLPAELREVTAILLKVDVMFAPGIENYINEGQQAQAALPVAVITRLFEFFVGPLKRVLLLLTVMICVVSAISILVSIYNSMSERRGEIAVMRALGAGRGTVMGIILLEATLLALGGGVLGWLLGHAGVLIASPWIEEHTSVHVGFLTWTTLPTEMLLIPGLIVLAIVVGVWPAISAYQTDVAKSLGK